MENAGKKKKSRIEKYRILSAFSEAIEDTRLQFDVLKNHNEYLITSALVNAEINGSQFDISALANYTKLHRSTLYNTLTRMSNAGLITIYGLDSDKKRRFVKAQEELHCAYIKYLEDLNKLLLLTNSELDICPNLDK